MPTRVRSAWNTISDHSRGPHARSHRTVTGRVSVRPEQHASGPGGRGHPTDSSADIQEATMATRNAAVGTRAPAFSLPCVDGPGEAPRQVSLDDYLDRWLVVLFYPRDFSLV